MNVGNEPLKLSHLSQFTQLNNVLKEIERLYPPVLGFSRGVVKDIEYNGYKIPAGWYIIVPAMLTHRLEEIYANPHSFDPDRFASPREEDKKHPLALVGFGIGNHSCLGREFAKMEMKIILSTILRNYDWQVTCSRKKHRYLQHPIQQPLKVQDSLSIVLQRLI